jgi:two-component system, LytTR family, response regulator
MPERIRAIVADDEPAGRRAIQLLLAKDPEIEVVAQCRTGEETVQAILQAQPDLLFLDVQMPGGNGFDVLAQLPADLVPVVLIVTAFEEYAITAFGVHAEEYVLKPFSDTRFRAAVAHAKERLRQRSAARAERAIQALKRLGGVQSPAAPPPSVGPDRIAIRTPRGIVLRALADIDWIEARGDYVRIHSRNRTDLLRQPIGELEKRLDATRFVRVHRSAIVNLAKVRELAVTSTGTGTAILQNGNSCRLSRSGRERLGRILDQPV